MLYLKWVKSKGGDSKEPLMSSVRTCLFATSCFVTKLVRVYLTSSWAQLLPHPRPLFCDFPPLGGYFVHKVHPSISWCYFLAWIEEKFAAVFLQQCVLLDLIKKFQRLLLEWSLQLHGSWASGSSFPLLLYYFTNNYHNNLRNITFMNPLTSF